jgi:arylsulfatase A-like enzyme
MQAQASTLSRFDFISKRNDKPEHTRQTYTAMVAEGDKAIGAVVSAFRNRQLWNTTLFIYSSDVSETHHPLLRIRTDFEVLVELVTVD